MLHRILELELGIGCHSITAIFDQKQNKYLIGDLNMGCDRATKKEISIPDDVTIQSHYGNGN